MEVIKHATEKVSPLTYLMGRKEELLEKLDAESKRTQDIIRLQNTKRQEVMIFLVLGAFCALCSCLAIMARESVLKNIYLPFFIIMVVLALVFLAVAIIKYPGSVKYSSTWKNFRDSKTYEDVLKESLAARKKIRSSISRLNVQLKAMDESLELGEIPDEV